MESHDRLKKIATHIPELWSSFTKQRSRITKLIRHSVHDQYKAIAESGKGGPKNLCKTVDRVLKK